MTYVFSEAFYKGDVKNMTILEQEVTKFINGKILNIDLLMDMYKEYVSWPSKDKYYYIPILVMLLKEYRRSMVTSI